MDYSAVWWLPVLTAVALGLLLYVTYAQSQKNRLSSSKTYSTKYNQIVSMVSDLTERANTIGRDVESIKDTKLLTYLESTLKILEMLLQIAQKVPPVGMDMHTINSIHYLAKDSQGRFDRLAKAVKTVKKGKAINHKTLLGGDTKAQTILPSGCYFCSLPYSKEEFAVARVKIDEVIREVWGCRTCREELQFTKKVKVLYFLKDGKPVHWAEIPGYQPSEDYWQINKSSETRKPKLEIVKLVDGVPPPSPST